MSTDTYSDFLERATYITSDRTSTAIYDTPNAIVVPRQAIVSDYFWTQRLFPCIHTERVACIPTHSPSGSLLHSADCVSATLEWQVNSLARETK